ncbi:MULTISPECIES: DUF11 domain-containing protein [unclassified Acinetobacter]|jgi:uncharacterized repeat protein (TIGR01451 family)|uniref:DUF11 domain-containing protein n=1 Tax=unclassified Acinetobacter TaxID=196816 RepID=UPI0002CFE19C|nr:MULTISPECIES: DUF11 domain-containing protein [unclassified Acinetobacter]ENW82511.1 hypothetical protein F908_01394 [Acinetobacter sp. NIPH 284]NWK83078.1 DUF11 domain-containing protein [Acinetobacter sp. SwsAc4]
MISRFKKSAVSKTSFIALLGLFIGFHSSIAFAQPKAGSNITNIASGDFEDEQGNLQTINSNPVILTVQAIYSLSLQSNQQNIGTIGSKLNFPHVLTNTGNIADNYKLALTQLTNDQFDLENIAVYVDRDQNGEPDDNNNLLNNAVLHVEAEESVALVVVGSIPKNVSTGNIANFSLTSTSQLDPNHVSATVSDVAKVVDDAVIQVTKSQNISTGKTGTEITYTFTYSNTGTALGQLLVHDTLPSGVSYQTGTAEWSSGTGPLTEADSNNEAGSTTDTVLTYKYATGEVEFGLTGIAALSKGTVSFKVKVNPNAAEKINNTANYKQYKNNTTTLLKDTNTNTVIFNVEQTLGVILNKMATSTADGGTNDLFSKPNTFTGTAKEVQFENYVWNTGQATDSYNLTIDKSVNVPSCAITRLYHSDGKTLLTDSNADGVVDTGSMAAGASKKIVLGVYFPANCVTTETLNFDITAISTTDTAIKNTTRDQLTNTNSVGSSDLYNNDGSGNGIGAVTSAGGQAWVNKSAVRGGTAVFPLVVENKSTVTNSYNLYASAAEIDVNSINTSLPAQWTVKFYDTSNDCQTLGNVISSTGNVAAGATKKYCAVVSVPTNTDLANLPIWFAIKSPMNAQADSIKDQVDIIQRQMTLANDRQGRVNIGGTVVYLHTLKNTGTVVEGNAAGQITFSVIPQNPNDTFTYTLYHDANNNGVIDATDPMINDLSIITGGLAPQASIQLLLKVQAPTTATNGMSSVANIVVKANNTIQGLALADIQNTDLTTVDPTQLRLTKEQTKDENCALTSVTVINAVYGSTPLQVKPNQCVTYRLTLKNEGATSASNVVINDVVPAYSNLRTGLPPSITQGTVTVNTDQIAGNVGTLAPQGQAAMYFSIRVSP